MARTHLALALLLLGSPALAQEPPDSLVSHLEGEKKEKGALSQLWDLITGRIGAQHAAPPAVSQSAADLHRKLFVVDLHADTLLWNRNLLRKGDRGEIDV